MIRDLQKLKPVKKNASYRSGNALKTQPKSAHDKFKTVSYRNFSL